MRPAALSVALLTLLLVLSLSFKVLAFGVTHRSERPSIATYLKAEGMAVTLPAPDVMPGWIVGTLGACEVRMVEINPQGWSRDFISVDVGGQKVKFWFDGRRYDQQPVSETSFVDYRNRLLRYFGVPAPPPVVLAVIVSPACPAGLFGDRAAATLTG
jgi:hypothetical protein